MLKQFILTALIVSAAPVSYAQFGSGIVFDPTQSAHAAQQILQANQIYTTTVETERNVIGAYNLAQKMANLPQALYTSYANLGRQQWTILTQPANTYGNSIPWMNAASAGYGAAAANQTASIPRTGQISGYGSLSPQGQQAIAARGATVDLSDAVNASSLQTAGTIRANSAQREADISQLEAGHSFLGSIATYRDGDSATDQPGIIDRIARPAGHQSNASGSGTAADDRPKSATGQSQVIVPNRQ